MTVTTGFKSTDIESRTTVVPVTVNPIAYKRTGQDVISWGHVFSVQAGTIAADSTMFILNIPGVGSVALVGDLILIGGKQVAVSFVSADYLTLAQSLPSAPAVSTPYELFRCRLPYDFTAQDTFTGSGPVTRTGVYLTGSQEWTAWDGTVYGTISPPFASIGSFTAVSVTGNTSLAGSSAARLGVAVYNTDATNSLLVAYGFTATAANYSVIVLPGGYLEVPNSFVRVAVNAIASAGTITANVTQGF